MEFNLKKISSWGNFSEYIDLTDMNSNFLDKIFTLYQKKRNYNSKNEEKIRKNPVYIAEMATAITLYEKVLEAKNFSDGYSSVELLMYHYPHFYECFKSMVCILLKLEKDFSAPEYKVSKIYFSLKKFFPDNEFMPAILSALNIFLSNKNNVNVEYIRLVNEVKESTKDKDILKKIKKNKEKFFFKFFDDWKLNRQYNLIFFHGKHVVASPEFSFKLKIKAYDTIIKIFKKFGINELVEKYIKEKNSFLKKGKPKG